MSQRVLLPRQSAHADGGSGPSQKQDDKREPSPSSSTPKKRGPLVTSACNACRRRKVKCNGNKPQCSNCSKRSIPCIYDETTRSESLRAVQDRLKEANDEIENLKRHILLFADDTQDLTKRPSWDQAGAEVERQSYQGLHFRSDGSGLPFDFPGRFSLAQDSSDSMETDPPAFTESGRQSLRTDNLPEGTIVVTIPAMPNNLGDHTGPTSRLGAPPSDQMLQNDQFLQIHQGPTKPNLYTALHHMQPLNLVPHDEISKPCILQHLRCRECLAEGMRVEDVIGSEVLDLTCLVVPEKLTLVHPFTSWIISYVDAFSGVHGLDWCFKIASVYCMFHLFRWLVLPTAENYARVPDFVKPTPLQLFIPHPFWVDFVILPGTRNDFILHPHPNQLRQWTQIFLQARINWPNTDMASTVRLDRLTNSFHLASDFEETIRRIENWYLPSQKGIQIGE